MPRHFGTARVSPSAARRSFWTRLPIGGSDDQAHGPHREAGPADLLAGVLPAPQAVGAEKTYWEGVADCIKQDRIAETRRFLWELEALHEADSSVNILEAAREDRKSVV